MERLVLVHTPLPVCQPQRVFTRPLYLGVVCALRLVTLALGGARDDDPPSLVEQVLGQFGTDRMVCAEHRAHLATVGPAK